MPTVRFFSLFSLVSVSEGKVTLAEDLGLLQGLSLNDAAKGKVDAFGTVTVDDASAARRTDLMKTAQNLEQMARRASMTHEAPTGDTVTVLNKFKDTLETYQSNLNAQVAQANAEIKKIADDKIKTCAIAATDFSARDAAEEQHAKDVLELTAAIGVKNAAEGALNDFISTLPISPATCEVPSDVQSDAAMSPFFAGLDAVAKLKDAWAQKNGATQSAISALGLAGAKTMAQQTTYEQLACQARSDVDKHCKVYGQCYFGAVKEFDDAASTHGETASVLQTEALVIKKSMCFVGLLLEQVNSPAAKIDSAKITECRDSALTDAEVTQLSMDDAIRTDFETNHPLKTCDGHKELTSKKPCNDPKDAEFTYNVDAQYIAACHPCGALDDVTDKVKIEDNTISEITE